MHDFSKATDGRRAVIAWMHGEQERWETLQEEGARHVMLGEMRTKNVHLSTSKQYSN